MSTVSWKEQAISPTFRPYFNEVTFNWRNITSIVYFTVNQYILRNKGMHLQNQRSKTQWPFSTAISKCGIISLQIKRGDYPLKSCILIGWEPTCTGLNKMVLTRCRWLDAVLRDPVWLEPSSIHFIVNFEGHFCLK